MTVSQHSLQCTHLLKQTVTVPRETVIHDGLDVDIMAAACTGTGPYWAAVRHVH